MDDRAKAKQLIAEAKRLVVFTGAGVSADSGVPTFRGSGAESFWGKYSPEELATPQGFGANPQRCYEFYRWRRSQLLGIQPNPAHRTIGAWQAGQGAVVITQNIDGLHERVAPPEAEILRVHGTLAEDCCRHCGYHEGIDLAHPPALRACPQCPGGDPPTPRYLRPAIVFFGEPLDAEVWERAEQASAEADVFVVVGTSGLVWPAAGLVHAAARRAAVIVINLEESPLDALATVAIHGRAAEVVPQLG